MIWNFVALAGGSLALILSAARGAHPSLRAWRAAIGLGAFAVAGARLFLGIPLAPEGLGVAWFGVEFWFTAEDEARRYTTQTGQGPIAKYVKGFHMVAVGTALMGVLLIFGKAIWG